MKQIVTVKDIEILSDKQKQNLNNLWMPGKYDVAIANICKDITSEEYEQYEFVIGGIELFNGRRILLHDIKGMDTDKTSDEDDETDTKDSDSDFSSEDDIESNEYSDDESEDSEELDSDFNYARPTSFIKDECIPLLSIGQLIDILQKNNFGKSSFYLSAFIDELSCVIGQEDISMDNFNKEFKETELCDVLWESVKTLL